MNDRDCESCKKFSRTDPHESEGYCDAKRTWVDPQEGEDCKMHEFTLHSATKYKDGTPIMTEPERVYCEADSALIHGDTDNSWIPCNERLPEPLQNVLVCTVINTVTVAWINGNHWELADTGNGHTENCTFDEVEYWMHLPEPPESQETDNNSSYIEAKAAKNSLYGKCASNQLDSLEQRVDELSEEYDIVLKTHGDTLEQHTERITINEGNIDSISADVEDLQRKVYQIYRFLDSVDPDFFARIQDETMHKGSNFCGNCAHASVKDGICTCELSGEIVDPDSASCSMFEPPF